MQFTLTKRDCVFLLLVGSLIAIGIIPFIWGTAVWKSPALFPPFPYRIAVSETGDNAILMSDTTITKVDLAENSLTPLTTRRTKDQILPLGLNLPRARAEPTGLQVSIDDIAAIATVSATRTVLVAGPTAYRRSRHLDSGSEPNVATHSSWIEVRDFKSLALQHRHQSEMGFILKLCVSADEVYLAVLGEYLELWRVDTWPRILSKQTLQGGITCLTWDSKTGHVIVGTGDGSLFLLDCPSLKPLASRKISSGPILDVFSGVEGSIVVARYYDSKDSTDSSTMMFLGSWVGAGDIFTVRKDSSTFSVLCPLGETLLEVDSNGSCHNWRKQPSGGFRWRRYQSMPLVLTSISDLAFNRHRAEVLFLDRISIERRGIAELQAENSKFRDQALPSSNEQ